MDIAAINEEFKRIRTLLDEGAALSEQHKHEEAQKVLFEALKQIESLKSSETDRIECLMRLGDAYFAQKRFIEAQAVYKQLQSALAGFEGLDQKERSTILFKLAKSTEKIQDFDYAKELFAELTTVAESCMQPGEPLLTEIYEAYSSLLRRAKLEPVLLKELEQKSRFSRQRQSGIPADALFDEKDAERKKQRRLADEEAFQKLNSGQQLVMLAKRHPRKALLVFSSPILLSLILLITVAGLAVLGIDAGSTAPLQTNDTYSSIDGSVQLNVLSPQQVEVTSASKSTVRARNLNPWSELLESVRPQSQQYWLVNHGNILEGQDGIAYHKSDSRILRTRKAMQTLAVALQKSAESGNYRPTINELVRSGNFIVDPDLSDISFLVFPCGEKPREEAAAGKDLNRKPKVERASIEEPPFQQMFEKYTNNELAEDLRILHLDDRKPLLVVAYVQGKSCAILAVNQKNYILKTIDGSKNQLYFSMNPAVLPFEFNESKAAIPDIVGKKTLLVADRSREQVREKYHHLLSAMIMLIVLIPAGYVLYKLWTRESAQFDYYHPPERSHEVWMWLFYVGLCTCYLGYIAWIVFS